MMNAKRKLVCWKNKNLLTLLFGSWAAASKDARRSLDHVLRLGDANYIR